MRPNQSGFHEGSAFHQGQFQLPAGTVCTDYMTGAVLSNVPVASSDSSQSYAGYVAAGGVAAVAIVSAILGEWVVYSARGVGFCVPSCHDLLL